jgi:hypothetical protein
MLTKPTVAAVRLIITTTLVDASVQAFIDDAELIARGCTVVAGYEEEVQAAIVKYIAAHLISVQSGKSGVLTQKALGDASESYASGAMGDMLKASRYGQQALLLDPSGCLANLGKRRVSVKAM